MKPEGLLPCSQDPAMGSCPLSSRNLGFPTVRTGNVNQVSQDPTKKHQDVDAVLMAVYTVRGPDALQPTSAAGLICTGHFIKVVI
jgi:hypothetical protein